MKNRKPIPPPMQPPAPQEQQIMVPFLLAETTRMFLNFLALDSALPEAHRNVISDWLHSHNANLTAYLLEHYGPHGTLAANELAKQMAAGFLKEIKADRDSNEAALFSRLEEELGDGDSPDQSS